MPAPVAAIDVTTEGVGPARANGAQDAQLAQRDQPTPRGDVLGFVSADDVSHLDGPISHDAQMESAMAS